jgi:hypothetical protein
MIHHFEFFVYLPSQVKQLMCIKHIPAFFSSINTFAQRTKKSTNINQ